MNITIREVTQDTLSADLPAIARVHLETWHTTYTGIVPQAYLDSLTFENRLERWQKHSANIGLERRLFVAVLDGQIVGFADCGKERNADPEFDGELTGFTSSSHSKNTALVGSFLRLSSKICRLEVSKKCWFGCWHKILLPRFINTWAVQKCANSTSRLVGQTCSSGVTATNSSLILCNGILSASKTTYCFCISRLIFYV
jgi:hypothetical protein